jgi:hypothetical protein
MKYVEIPEIFYATATGKPFQRCADCERDLIEHDLDYFVEKVIKRFPEYEATDIVLEYAICLECHQKVRMSLSEESIRRVEAYFSENVDIYKRMRSLTMGESLDINNWISHCMIKDIPVTELREYEIVGHFKGDRLTLSYLPGIVSIQSMEEVSELLSKKTKDELDGYMDRFLDVPPEFRELFTPRPAFVL